MSDNKKIIGATLATTAALLFASAPVKAADLDAGLAKDLNEAPTIQCFGANACKGQGACKSVYNGCKGQNTCKTQGSLMEPTNNDCTIAGGETSQ